MREGWHDFMARVGNEIVVIKDVPAFICDTCDEVEYTLEISREIDVIMKDFSSRDGCWQSLWRRGRMAFKPLRADSTGEHGLQ
jgi:YgiT-type zinc finger domain-containing protein